MARSSSLSLPTGTADPGAIAQEPPRALRELADQAGIVFNGSKPWDIQVHDDRLYSRVIRQGSLGLGEAYMDGWWDCPRLDQLFDRLLSADADAGLTGIARLQFLVAYLKDKLVNRQSRRRAAQVGEHHYDIGNDVFEALLDPSMSYSCGY